MRVSKNAGLNNESLEGVITFYFSENYIFFLIQMSETLAIALFQDRSLDRVERAGCQG